MKWILKTIPFVQEKADHNYWNEEFGWYYYSGRATRYATKEEAEAKAVFLAAKYPEIMGKIEVIAVP